MSARYIPISWRHLSKTSNHFSKNSRSRPSPSAQSAICSERPLGSRPYLLYQLLHAEAIRERRKHFFLASTRVNESLCQFPHGFHSLIFALPSFVFFHFYNVRAMRAECFDVKIVHDGVPILEDDNTSLASKHQSVAD